MSDDKKMTPDETIVELERILNEVEKLPKKDKLSIYDSLTELKKTLDELEKSLDALEESMYTIVNTKLSKKQKTQLKLVKSDDN